MAAWTTSLLAFPKFALSPRDLEADYITYVSYGYLLIEDIGTANRRVPWKELRGWGLLSEALV